MGKGSRNRARRSTDQDAATTPVAYAGAPMTPWAAAWAWSDALVLHDLRRRQGTKRTRDDGRVRDVDPVGELERLYLTRALTCAAQHQGIDVQQTTVDSPAALGATDLTLVGGQYLADDVTAMLMWVPGARHKGALPQTGDPGFERYIDLQEMLYTGTDRTADELTDPDNPISQEISRNVEECTRATRRAARIVLGATLAHTDGSDAVPVSRLTHLLNEHLEGAQA